MNNEIDRKSKQNQLSSDAGASDHPAREHDRRSFLRFLSIGAGSAIIGGAFACGRSALAAGTDGSAGVAATTRASALVDDHGFWTSIQDSFIRSTSDVVLNVDAGSVAPKLALRALNRDSSVVEKGVIAGGFTTLASQRATIGSILGAAPDDTALVNGATDGIMHALSGFNWKAGDMIFYTDHEHPNVISVIKSLEFVSKIVPVKITLPTSARVSAAEIAAAVEAKVARHRPAKRSLCALVWSSPTYQTGVMLPIARMAAIARKYDMVSVCDAAHLMGMASIDFSRLDVDFLSTCGHKWQCGPSLTAALLRDPRLAGIWSTNSQRSSGKAFGPSLGFGAEVSKAGVSSVAKFDALIASCSLWDDIGRSKIEAYSLSLGAYLKSRIEQAWGQSSLRSPLADPELLSGITTFDPFADTPLASKPKAYKLFVDQLRDTHGFIVRAVKLPSDGQVRSGIRISTPLWVEQGDIDRLIDVMQKLAKKIQSVKVSIDEVDPTFAL
ncbi:aminotransferase class V-fold PLP-dependent enzyme [Pseudoduganella buxea]|nr:aminotransferase class V-fold PLP-dependent enzyme [Pseudoduganella buxea]GGC14265.1 aminotransferase [Pseudoduganella buxea]